MINILFICMGNICRSPAAEGFFAKQLQDSNYKEMVSIDSAATHSYHIGHAPDPRAIATGEKFDVQIGHLRARKVTPSDFDDFDLIIGMDESNMALLRAIQPANSRAELQLMMAYHPASQADSGSEKVLDEVPDPYYGDMDGFVFMYELLELATAGLLKDIEGRLSQAD
jgi:protein-tyrosine phosphatase